MNRKIVLILAVLLVLSMSLISGCASSTPEEANVDGFWCYAPVLERFKPVMFDPYEGDPGKLFAQVPYVSEWHGKLSGSSIDYGLLVAHVLDSEGSSAPMAFVGTSTFAEANVDGKVGSLELDAIGDRPGPTDDWVGTLVVTGGSGELENLTMKADWWGPGFPPAEGGTDECGDMGLIYYSVE